MICHESMNHPKSVFFRHLTPWLGTAMTAMTFWGDKCHVHDPCSWPCWRRAESLGVAPPAGAQWEVPLAIGTHRNSKWNSKWAHSESILSPFSSFIYSIYDFNSSLVYFGFIAFKFNVKALQLLPRQIDTTTYNCALEAPCFFFPRTGEFWVQFQSMEISSQACVAGGDRRSADTLLQQMVKVGHVDVVSYNTPNA